jgi:hypothetical protein
MLERRDLKFHAVNERRSRCMPNTVTCVTLALKLPHVTWATASTLVSRARYLGSQRHAKTGGQIRLEIFFRHAGSWLENIGARE